MLANGSIEDCILGSNMLWLSGLLLILADHTNGTTDHVASYFTTGNTITMFPTMLWTRHFSFSFVYNQKVVMVDHIDRLCVICSSFSGILSDTLYIDLFVPSAFAL